MPALPISPIAQTKLTIAERLEELLRVHRDGPQLAREVDKLVHALRAQAFSETRQARAEMPTTPER